MKLCIKILLRMVFILPGSFFFWSKYQEELLFSDIHLLLSGRVREGLDQLLISPRRLRACLGPTQVSESVQVLRPGMLLGFFLAPSVVSFFCCFYFIIVIFSDFVSLLALFKSLGHRVCEGQ